MTRADQARSENSIFFMLKGNIGNINNLIPYVEKIFPGYNCELVAIVEKLESLLNELKTIQGQRLSSTRIKFNSKDGQTSNGELRL